MANKIDICPLCNTKMDKSLADTLLGLKPRSLRTRQKLCQKKKCQGNSLSFDCIDGQKRFVRGNIRVICNHCNQSRKKSKTFFTNMPQIFGKIYNISLNALVKKDQLSKDQIALLEQCLCLFSPQSNFPVDTTENKL